jgi:glycosyltransferase involved in cell wall biosynthesis
MAKKRKTSIDNNTCLVTFIIPAYNCRETITQLLNSFDYEYKNSFEVLIIDDGSKVPYKYTITDFLGTYPNTVIYIKKPNGN